MELTVPVRNVIPKVFASQLIALSVSIGIFSLLCLLPGSKGTEQGIFVCTLFFLYFIFCGDEKYFDTIAGQYNYMIATLSLCVPIIILFVNAIITLSMQYELGGDRFGIALCLLIFSVLPIASFLFYWQKIWRLIKSTKDRILMVSTYSLQSFLIVYYVFCIK